MSLAERDYARTPTSRPPAGPIPGLRMLSVNTWLIIVNVAVFLLGATLLRQPVEVSWGTAFQNGVSKDLQRKGVPVDRLFPVPGMPNIAYRPIVVPITDDQGRPTLDLTSGQQVIGQIGQARVALRPPLDAFGHFSTGKALVDGQVWRFITFQFLHADLSHLVFNMLGLWFFGGLVEEFLGRRRYLVFYLLCGVLGAGAYLLLNLLGYSLPTRISDNLPLLLVNDPYTPLIGASAGVFGILLAAAYVAPKAIVDVMFVLPMRLRTAVYIFLGLAALNLLRGGPNAGGDAAHVGGALAGYYCIRNTHILRNILSAVGLGERSGTNWSSRKGGVAGSRIMRTSPEQRTVAEVDRILEKVHRDGLASLTPAERAFLKQAKDAAPDY